MVFQCEIFIMLFSYDDEYIGRFSNLHQCTFKLQQFKLTLKGLSEAATRGFYKKGVLNNFAKFTAKCLRQILILKKSQATLLKKRPCHRCFFVNFAKILRKPFLQNTSEGETASALNKMFYLGCSSFTFEHFSDK